MSHSLQALKILQEQEFELRGKSYKFDANGDINQGYDVTMWRTNGRSIYVHDVVAGYHPSNNSFTYTSHRTSALFRDLQVGPDSAVSQCKRKKHKKK